MSTGRARLSVATPVVTMLPADQRRLGETRLHRRPGPDRRSRRPTRLPPPDLQRTHRAARRRDRTAAAPAIGIRWPPSATWPRAPDEFGWPPTCWCSDITIRSRSPSATAPWTKSATAGSSSGSASAASKKSSTSSARPSTTAERVATTRCGRFAPRCPFPNPPTTASSIRSSGMVVDPCAVQERVPIWIGGRTLRSLRRAATLADGWAPFNVSLQQVREWLGRFDLRPGFEVVLPPPAPLDPINEPERTRDTARRGRRARRHHRQRHLHPHLAAALPGESAGARRAASPHRGGAA